MSVSRASRVFSAAVAVLTLPQLAWSQDAAPPAAAPAMLGAPVELVQGTAQDAPAMPSAAPAGIDPSASSPVPSSGGGGGGARAWSGPSQKPKSEKTFWETVPPIIPYPRPGNFYIAPSGPGSYTFLDFVRGIETENRPPYPFLNFGQNPNPFFNVDFRYLDDPGNTYHDWLDPIKRIHLGDDWLLSFGGEVRNRWAYEENARLYNKLPQAGTTNDYDLFRTRVFADVWYRDTFRFYAEFLSAVSSTQSIPPSSSDINSGDIFNCFVEVKMFTIKDEGVYARIGRQELLFGSQRLVSPSDWSNTMRTFQGVSSYYYGDPYSVQAFCVRPVIVSAYDMDSWDDHQLFAGGYGKYRINKDISVDAYYYYLQNLNAGVATGTNKVTGTFDVSTLGTRFVGEHNQWLFDLEGAVQFGDWANQTTAARMYTMGLGYWFKDVPFRPTVWAYYDYASGDPNPGTGDDHRTFNTLFPFGHQYFGSLDVIGRQNIVDTHFELGMFPTDWCRVIAGYHFLSLDSAKDALYNPSGSVVRQDKTGVAGTDVGEALTMAVLFHLTDHQQFMIQYSELFSGTFIQKTAINAAAAQNMHSLWMQYTYKF